MNASPQEQKDRIWELMEAEKKRDRTLQRVSTVGWVMTLAALLFTAAAMGFNVLWAARAFSRGQVGMGVIFREAMPAVWAVGGISLVVAVISTAAVLLRFRAASLDEIRLRLSSLEQMVTDQAEAGDAGR